MDYKEIQTLFSQLKEKGYDVTQQPLFYGMKVTVYDEGHEIGDFVQHQFSYNNDSCVESAGFGFDDCYPWTVEQAVMLVDSFIKNSNDI